jgi:hypothetical protein
METPMSDRHRDNLPQSHAPCPPTRSEAEPAEASASESNVMMWVETVTP